MDEEDSCFGECVAARFDEPLADMFERGVVDAAVEVLAGLAGDDRAWSWSRDRTRRGTAVAPRRCSRAMVSRLRVKPGGEAIGVTIDDFATARGDGTFTVA
jgi:hypothetical protein